MFFLNSVKLSNSADKMFYLDLSRETVIANLNEVLWLYRYHDESMHKNIANMVTDYENYVKQLEIRSHFKTKEIQKRFKKYIYQICSKESFKNRNLLNGIVYMFKYIFI